jgi:hypothetical protein
MDIDRHWPEVLERKRALERLEEISSGLDGQAIWNELIAPLYERLRVNQQWPQGRCRSCQAVHPMAKSPSQSDRVLKHQMRCSKYIGPLEHTPAATDTAPLTGEPRVHCSCGERYPYWADDNATIKNHCPSRKSEWRGPQFLR